MRGRGLVAFGRLPTMAIRAWRGDITTLDVDAIVNTASASLLGGGGVVHRAAVPGLVSASRLLGGCRIGEAKATPGFDLPAEWVIHTVGPVWRGGDHGEPDLLASCYRRCLAVASGLGARSLAIPAIATGVYGYPRDQAAAIALAETGAAADCFDEIVLVAFDVDTFERYWRALIRRSAPSGSPARRAGASRPLR